MLYSERKKTFTVAGQPSTINQQLTEKRNSRVNGKCADSDCIVWTETVGDGERTCKGKYVYEFSLRNKIQQDALFYSQSISIVNLYMFRVGLLLIIRRYYSVYTAIGISCVYVGWHDT